MKRRTLIFFLMLALGTPWAAKAQTLNINSQAEWDTFASNPSYYTTVNLNTNDVTVTSSNMVGTENNPFTGTFNGQGNTLNVSISNTSGQGTAPFHYIQGATIKNLVVSGNVTSTYHGSGLVGFTKSGTNTIENCLVHTNVSSGDKHIGGIVGHGKGSTVKIIGCAYDGTLSSSNHIGGLLGWADGGINLTVTNSIFDGTIQNNSNKFHPIAFRNGSVSATGTFINCYYTKDGNFYDSSNTNNLFHQGSGHVMYGVEYKHAYSIEGGANVTVALYGTTPYVYNVSGITGYSTYTNSSSTNSGIVYNNKVYAGNSDQEYLHLSYTGSGALAGYQASSGNFSGDTHTGTNDAYILIMPSSAVTISATLSSLITEISSKADWETFCNAVNSGTNYQGVTVRLMNDINEAVNTMCGAYTSDSDKKPFSGTFDGQGHTLPIYVENQKRFAAPFKCVEGATIQNLRITGTIDGENSGDGKLLAGLVGVSFGNTNIIECSISATITTTHGADAALAGIVAALKSGTLTIEGCVFDGTLYDTNVGDDRCGGIVGYQYSDYVSQSNRGCIISNTLFAPANLHVSTSADNNYTYTFARLSNNANVTINNCYYTKVLGTAQGTKVYTITGGPGVTVAMNGTANPHYDAIGLNFYTPGLSHDNTLYATSGDNVSLNLGYDGSGTVIYSANGIALSGSNPYTYTMPNDNVVITAEIAPITDITSIDDWNTFANAVNNGHDYHGETVTLSSNISGINQMVGTTSANPFRGTFNGQGNLMEVSLSNSNTSESFIAPFRYVTGATIENVKVTGSVSSNGLHSSGLVGRAESSVTLENCLVSVNVRAEGTTGENASYAGGLIGHGSTSTITIEGCAFTGDIYGNKNTNYTGGLLAWCDNANVTMSNSIFAGTHSGSNLFAPLGCTGSVETGKNADISNCYYTVDRTINSYLWHMVEYDDDSDKYQGKHAYTIKGSGATVAFDGSATHTYNVSGITAYSTGIAYNGTIYAGNGDNVSLALSNSNTGKYYASAGTLAGSGPYTLTMPAENVEIRDAMVLVNASGNTWNNPNHWSPSRVPTADDAVTIYYNVTIPANCVANANRINVTDNAVLTIADGGQLFCNSEVTATVQKNIAAHGPTVQDGGWNFIASPITYPGISPTDAGLITDNLGSSATSETATYDLYKFEEHPDDGDEWRNYRNDLFNLDNAIGYLYANVNTITLNFTGTLRSCEYPAYVGLDYYAPAELAGWNLLGNPFPCNAKITTNSSSSCYKVSGGSIVAATSAVVGPCCGAMVKATYDGDLAKITPTTESVAFSTGHQLNLFVANEMTTRGERSMIDNAIVSFNENSQLEKFVFFEDNAKLYIPQNGKDFAIAYSEGQGEMPVNFKATKNGTYTLTVNPEGVDLNYLHLIDNMTGMDVDLLQTPSYTFEASTRDYESRFKLVFAGASTDSATDESFAYYDGSEWKVSNEGEATLQVVDVLGRIVKSESINGNFSLNLNQKAGVYMLRLINGENVKVQKVVVR